MRPWIKYSLYGVLTLSIIYLIYWIVQYHLRKKKWEDEGKKLTPIVRPFTLRGCDPGGCGHYGAPRGMRSHQGVDIKAAPGSPIYAPISGKVSRYARPYADDPDFKGIYLEGEGGDQGVKVKLFYMDPESVVRPGDTISRGQLIGYAQDISNKYDKVRPHVHLEMEFENYRINPEPFLT